MSSICGLILAKGSSNRLPNKNRIDFAGKPMFVWNLEKCLKIFSRTFVSSDSDWILSETENLGGIPIKRPIELCGDCPNIPVYQHAIGFMDGVDGIVAVQANSPTVKSKLIMKAKEALDMGIQELITIHSNGTKYGSIWAMTIRRLKNYGDPYNPTAQVLLRDYSVDIHDQNDLIEALKQL